jgi:hypothetical protein
MICLCVYPSGATYFELHIRYMYLCYKYQHIRVNDICMHAVYTIYLRAYAYICCIKVDLRTLYLPRTWYLQMSDACMYTCMCH